MRLKGIFWDNDGVLVDTEHLYFRATLEALQTVGIELTRETFIDLSLKRGESVLSLAQKKGGSQPSENELRRMRNGRYAELLRLGVPALTGVENVLRGLHGKVRMGIVTSSLRDHFNLIHQSTGLLGYFDFVLTREDYQHSKPDPEPYLTALARSGLRPEECVAVEDSERGLQAAAGAGLRCLVLPGELTRSGDFAAAHRILGGIDELPAALAQC